MAYAAVISVKQTIQRLVDSRLFSVDSSAREILGSAYKEAAYVQEVLKRVHDRSKKLESLEGQIREAVHNLEDSLELHQSNLFLESSSPTPPTLLLDSERLRQEIRSFIGTAKKLADDYVAESDDLEEEAAATSNTCSGVVEMVGFSEELSNMKHHVTSVVRPDDWGVFSIIGRRGTGRTYVAKSILDYVDNCRELSFDCSIWVHIGPNYKCMEILKLILTQILIIEKGDGGGCVCGEVRAIMGAEGSEKNVKHFVAMKLVGLKYMIVLDDVCDTRILDYLSDAFAIQNNGSVVLITTEELELALYWRPYCIYRMEDVGLMSEDVHWDYFRYVVFRLQAVPPQTEEAGRKIVRNCRGLGICMSKVLLFLLRVGRNPEAWNRIANDQQHPLFHVVDELSEMHKLKEDFANLIIESASDREQLSIFILDNGISADIEFTKKILFPERFFPKMEVISFVGMAGIGKTTFVNKIFEYVKDLDHFDPYICVWLTLGPKYRSENILMDILAQMPRGIDKRRGRYLADKRFLIVMDDVWNEEPLRCLASLFPNIKGRALVTTRLVKVGSCKQIDIVREMRLLNKEESWNLLRRKVFGEDLCPYELEKFGKKIAENCDGLPLTIVKVAKLLSEKMSPEYWKKVANKNSDFTDALQDLSKHLVPCYESLPQYLKPCFLYMGIFPQEYEVSTSKVLDLWIAEGFLEPNSDQCVEDFAAQCLMDLVDRSLVMICHKGNNSNGVKVKTFRLNSVFWHLSNIEAAKNKFFHGLDSYKYGSFQRKMKQRIFCIRNCILLSIKEINHDLMMDSFSTAHSLLCTGPYHQYPVSICLELRLLRVLDAQAIRFYEFPIEVVKLIHLRHLAITCDGQLPKSISGLWNLRFLVVSRHLRIGDSSLHLPEEIWNMKELRHLQVTGSNLPNPSSGTVLPNLVTLLDVSSRSCTKEVFRGIPNLKKLGIQMELAPESDDAMNFYYLNHIAHILRNLESLKCIIMNPEIVAIPPAPHPPMFSSSLEKLSLSGMGYPWGYMEIIGGLKILKVLKLRCYAFQGDEWETGDRAFEKLEHLVIEDTDLVRWRTTIFSFSELKHLSIKHCYQLEELPPSFFCHEMIEVVDCNPFAVKWAKQMKKRKGSRALPTVRDSNLAIHVESCWDARQP